MKVMKRLQCSLNVLGLVSFFIMGASVLDASANNGDKQCRPKHPLCGVWGFSQENEVTAALGGATSTEIGVFTIDECGHIEGQAVVNTPCVEVTPECPFPNGAAFEFFGPCGIPEKGIVDCTFEVRGFEGILFGRKCVVMTNDEIHCIDTSSPALGDVILTQGKRSGGCSEVIDRDEDESD